MSLDTIAALATAAGPAAVAIVRVSGPDALPVAERLFRRADGHPPAVPLGAAGTHRAHVGWLVDPATEARVDQALVLVMRGPTSFTGEDVVELQTHGGAAAARVLELVLAQGVRLAAPGEFTKRAFVHGRLDLAQAEAVADVVEARSERALALALHQLDGRLSREVATARAALVGLLARLEAAIDFPDEVDDVAPDEAVALLAGAEAGVAAVLATAREGELVREGLALALVGRPNAGKSSLLNALVGRDRAIVTPVPGTTRDVLEEGLVLGGVAFRVADTAGIRETEDAIEAIGVARSRAALHAAGVVVLVVDLGAGVGELERALAAEAEGRPLVVVGNKLDAWAGPGDPAEVLAGLPGRPVLVSAATGDGLPALCRLLPEVAQGGVAAPSPVAINARHRQCLGRAHGHLAEALGSARAGLPADFLAIDVKAAIAALGEVTGDAITEDVLEEVFRRFCVGK
jgi:tRNA modification GTPase